jgi:aryl-alcohol dehydrogenase
MSFPWCGGCANCEQELLSYCVHAIKLKMKGVRADGSTLMSKNGKPIYSAFFQQSSFGTYALTQERYAVKVRKDAPLELLGPLACSGQTGAGAIFNVIKPKPGDSIAVFGVGAVGLSALLAAKIAGCDPIIAVDVNEERLVLARKLGATHAINHSTCSDILGNIRSIAERASVVRSTHPPFQGYLAKPPRLSCQPELAFSSAAPAKAPEHRSKCLSCRKAVSFAAPSKATASPTSLFHALSI